MNVYLQLGTNAILSGLGTAIGLYIFEKYLKPSIEKIERLKHKKNKQSN